jgi:hypothetical protein
MLLIGSMAKFAAWTPEASERSLQPFPCSDDRMHSGYCSAGSFAATPGSASCSQAPAGYYKPRASYSDNYYICGEGFYSSAGASACTTCPSSTTAGTSYCMFPTSQPSSMPSSLPTRQPTTQPSCTPTSQPSSQPSMTSAALCKSGTYYMGGICALVPAGSLCFLCDLSVSYDIVMKGNLRVAWVLLKLRIVHRVRSQELPHAKQRNVGFK